jgi:hypothetical protein
MAVTVINFAMSTVIAGPRAGDPFREARAIQFRGSWNPYVHGMDRRDKRGDDMAEDGGF